MSTPPSSPQRPGTEPLSAPVALLAGGALAVVVAVLLRLYHGSWERVAVVSVAPALFAAGVLALWAVERRRGRALLPRFGTILLFAALGALAGASASVMIATLGPPWAGAVTGLYFGTLTGVGWTRRPRPAATESSAPVK